MRIMNCIAICQVARFSAKFQNHEGIAAVCSIRVATKIIDWCVSWGQWVYILSTILNTRNQQEWSYTDAHCVNIAVKVAVNCCFSSSTCINQLAPGSGCGGGSGSGAGITDDDISHASSTGRATAWPSTVSSMKLSVPCTSIPLSHRHIGSFTNCIHDDISIQRRCAWWSAYHFFLIT
ncbi:hypothetical protein NP493_1808g00012 [Ridgeia piscesae]|uniref:Uncharacterized protein n=1 Tax=Ridgeia piscesae TaxID=27915 RepID=A0AAD9JRY1_RIDPI|nr:hypothetical protein NP493_1808g00012 [Ridgeia piscesae]